MKYADDKSIPFVVMGEDERTGGKATLKNMTGDQTLLSIAEISNLAK